MPSIQHLLETRFSVRLRKAPLERSWLWERVDLLRRICLPSVAAQTQTEFTWLLFCDESTDPDVVEVLRDEERRLPMLRLELTGKERPPLAAVHSIVRADTDVLITTRLDSDDAIADSYLEAVQDYVQPFHCCSHEELVVNFPRGYRLDVPHRRLYRGWMPNSCFHSFFERPRRTRPQTVMSAGGNLRHRYAGYRRLAVLPRGVVSHARLHQHYPTHQDESMAAWLIAVHQANLVNRIPSTARPMPPGARPDGFTLGPLSP